MSNMEKIIDHNEKVKMESTSFKEQTIKNLLFLKELEFNSIEINYNRTSWGDGHRMDSIVHIKPPTKEFVNELQDLLARFFEEKIENE